MERDKIFRRVNELEEILNKVALMDLPSTSKQNILKALDCEIYFIKKDLIEELGKQEYKKLSNSIK